MALPPDATSVSVKRPNRGLAVRPEKPSEPPHLRPTRSRDRGSGGARHCGCGGDQIVDRRQTRSGFVRHVLGDHAAHACTHRDRHRLQQRRHLVGFAAEADQQHTGRIGIGRQLRQDRPGSRQIVAELRTAEGMHEGVDAVDPTGMTRGRERCDALGGAGHTAHGRQDPDFIARTSGRAVAAVVSVPDQVRGGDTRRCLRLPDHGVVLGQTRGQIVAVHPVASVDRPGGDADGLTVFAHKIAIGMRVQGDLVAGRYCFPCRQRLSIRQRHLMAGRQIGQHHGDAVLGMDLQESWAHDTGIICADRRSRNNVKNPSMAGSKERRKTGKVGAGRHGPRHPSTTFRHPRAWESGGFGSSRPGKVPGYGRRGHGEPAVNAIRATTFRMPVTGRKSPSHKASSQPAVKAAQSRSNPHQIQHSRSPSIDAGATTAGQ